MTSKAEKKTSKATSNKQKTSKLIASKADKALNAKKTEKCEESSEKKPKLGKQRKPMMKAKKGKPAENINMPNIIPKSYPNDLIVTVKNLPEKCKQSDIISAFSRFGSIAYIQKVSQKKVFIGFLQLEEAEAAKQVGKVLVKGQKVIVRSCEIRNKIVEQIDEQKCELWRRTVLVFQIDATITEDDIREHFKSCGEIESIKLSKQKSNFNIIFEKDSSAAKALKLHNTVLKDKTILVRRKSDAPVSWDLKRTIALLNPSGLTKLEGSKLTKLFENCGEIETCDVLCYKNRLAMLTFKHEDSIPKALKLSGTMKDGIQIEVELYSTKIQKKAIPVKKTNDILNSLLKKSNKSKVCIKSVAEGLTEKDVCNLFKTCGPVKTVTISDDRSAVVEFDGIEGYCKAFLLHDCVFGGRKLILQPYSEEEITKEETKKSQKEKRSLINSDISQLPTKLKKIK